MAAESALPPVYVYDFKGDRYARLRSLWSFYAGEQHDHCQHDWHGRRLNREPYLSSRVRNKGFAVGNNRTNHDDRRPNVPMGLMQRVVDRFVEVTCGRQASIGVRGDEDSTLAFEATLEASEAWDAVNELVTIGGACGSAAIVPVVGEDGCPSHEVYKPYQLYVRRWAEQRGRWIPAEVIHQTVVDVEAEDEKTRDVTTKRMVRTRMWTERHTVTFKDVDKASWKPEQQLDLAEEDAMIEHGWGRCPVVWHQNIRDTESPDGQPDSRNSQNLELSDTADKLASHAVKATRANTEPTVVRSDRDMMFHLHPAIAKGVGNEIRTSEVGKVGFLETTGDSVKMAWDAVDRLTLTILRNCNCVVFDVDMAMAARGSGDSGEALQQRQQSMQKRCNRKRVPLRRTIQQLAKMWLTKLRAAGICCDDDGEDEASGKVRLPPRCYKVDVEAAEEAMEADEGKKPAPKGVSPAEVEANDEHEEDEARSRAAGDKLLGINKSPAEVLAWSDMQAAPETYGPHKMGEGMSLDIKWPPYNELTATQVQNYLQALSTATGSKPVLSQQTGIELGGVALGLTDTSAEKRRILEEKSQGLERIQGIMGGMDEPGEEAEEEGADAAEDGEPEEDDGDIEPSPGGPPPPKGKKPKAPAAT